MPVQFQQNDSMLSMKSSRIYFVLFGLSALTVLYFLPERFFTSGLNGDSYCLLKQLVGVDCPGCGFTRASYYLMHLKFTSALKLNCCVVFLLPVFLVEILYLVKRNEQVKKTRFIVYLCFCISLLLLYIFRIFYH
jgi:hypothetical protein